MGNGGMWATPAASLDWLAMVLGLPREFLVLFYTVKCCSVECLLCRGDNGFGSLVFMGWQWRHGCAASKRERGRVEREIIVRSGNFITLVGL